MPEQIQKKYSKIMCLDHMKEHPLVDELDSRENTAWLVLFTFSIFGNK